jgi:hypothetical protein
MSYTQYKSFIIPVSKSYYGIEVSLGHGTASVLMILAFFLVSALNSTLLASSRFEIIKLEQSSFLFYLSALAITGVNIEIFWNLHSIIEKKTRHSE